MEWCIHGRLLAASLLLDHDFLSMNMNMGNKGLGVKHPCIIPISLCLKHLSSKFLLDLERKTDCQQSGSNEEPSVLVVSLFSGTSV